MKKRVHSEILKDMEKYIKGINPNNYKKWYGPTDETVIKEVRDYYDKHLPVDIYAWIRVNEPEKNLIYGSGLEKQIEFIVYQLWKLLASNDKEWNENLPMVISTHYSKSVKLPVFQIKPEKYNIEIILRYNFYDWKVSVKSEDPLDMDFMGLINSKEEISPLYCEGFPREKVYGSYDENHSQFTVELGSYYEVYTFIFLINNYLKDKNKK